MNGNCTTTEAAVASNSGRTVFLKGIYHSGHLPSGVPDDMTGVTHVTPVVVYDALPKSRMVTLLHWRTLRIIEHFHLATNTRNEAEDFRAPQS
jgi:hypothetical protein